MADRGETGPPALWLEHVSKRYAATMVVRDVTLDLRPGECVALVGENGAGKSTLVGIISGKIAPTEGSVSIDGEQAAFRSPRDARARGIAVIPQELSYVPDLTVAENVMLGNWPTSRPIARQRWMRAQCRALFDRLHIGIDVRRTMAELSLADRQLVEVTKALASEARVLILDEPTAALYAREAEALLEQLRDLKRKGVSLLYISHRLDECFEIADRVAVLRNGELVDVSPSERATVHRTVQLMLGRDYREPPARASAETSGPALLEVDRWSRRRQPALYDVSFDIRAGEVLGIFGLVGSGGEAVARGLGGHDSAVSGSLRRGTRRHVVPRSPLAARRLSIAYIPAERKSDGLALSQSVSEHLTMMVIGRFAKSGWMRKRAQLSASRQLAERFDVRCKSVKQDTEQLSGGNQQKVLLASRIAASPGVLVLHEPTRGVDIGSRAQIHGALADFTRHGAAAVVITSDLQEAIGATDRLLVMRSGRVVAELTGADKTAPRALALAAAEGSGSDATGVIDA
jgi:ABC-type sugar transport system ATPase subunit